MKLSLLQGFHPTIKKYSAFKIKKIIELEETLGKKLNHYPIGSMYGIFTYIYKKKYCIDFTFVLFQFSTMLTFLGTSSSSSWSMESSWIASKTSSRSSFETKKHQQNVPRSSRKRQMLSPRVCFW